MKLLALAAALALAASPALAQSARVVDGDTLKVDGVTYRLWGIDTPVPAQPCADGWPAGKTATELFAIGDAASLNLERRLFKESIVISAPVPTP